MGGKNPGHPKNKGGGGGGGGGADFAETIEQKPFHSKEYEQQQLDELLNAKERPTWDQFKEQQRQKGLLDGAEERLEQEAQARFRAELDKERDGRLAAARSGKQDTKKKKHKHKSDKHRHSSKREKHKKHKKHKKRRRHESSSSDSSSSDESGSSDESSDEEEARRSKKKRRSEKRDKKAPKKMTGGDGAVSLKSFFADSSGSDSD